MALWTPADITTALWLDAADSSTLFDATSGGSAVAADGTVARWEDKSGNARHVTQSGSTARPLRKTSVQNSKDVLRFDGSNDNLVIPSFISSQPVFACGVYQTSVNNSPFLGGSGVSINSNSMLARRSTGAHLIFSGTVLAGGTHGSAWLTRSDLLNSADSYIFANGSSVASGDAGTRHTITRVGVNLADFATGDLGEIVLLLSVPTTETRQLIEGYLAHKWGLAGSLPVGHPYKDAAPGDSIIQTRRRRDQRNQYGGGL